MSVLPNRTLKHLNEGESVFEIEPLFDKGNIYNGMIMQIILCL